MTMRRSGLFFFTPLFLTLAGCGASRPYISHPDMAGEIKSTKVVGIVVGGASCYQYREGKTVRLKDKSVVMRSCVTQGALDAFMEKGYGSKVLTSDDEGIRGILKTYSRIHRNVRNHFPDGEEPVPEPVNFGDLSSLMKRHRIDILAVIYAAGNSSTADQKAVKAGLAALQYALTSIATYDLDSGYADIALIGPDGTLIYYEMQPVSTFSLTNKENSKGVFTLILDHVDTAAKQ